MRCVLESHARSMFKLFTDSNRIATDYLHSICDRGEDATGQIASADAEDSTLWDQPEYASAETAGATSVPINEASLLDLVCLPPQAGEEPHLFRDIRTATPEIDHIAAFRTRARAIRKGRHKARGKSADTPASGLRCRIRR